MNQDVNSIFYWWPLIKDVPVPKPKTILVPYAKEVSSIIEPAEEDDYSKFGLVEDVGDACDEMGYPVFIRCGGMAAKHEWRDSCYVERREDLPSHIAVIAEEVLSVMGVRVSFDGIAVREFLPIEHLFTAFKGMPVGKEFRFFVEDGKYRCHHPYWPPASISLPSIDTWFEVLKAMQVLEGRELDLLKAYASEIAKALDKGPLGYGDWSLDFCKTIDGTWNMTDLATGKESYHWSTCEFAPEDMKKYPNPEDPKKIAKIYGPTKRAELRKKRVEELWAFLKEETEDEGEAQRARRDTRQV